MRGNGRTTPSAIASSGASGESGGFGLEESPRHSGLLSGQHGCSVQGSVQSDNRQCHGEEFEGMARDESYAESVALGPDPDDVEDPEDLVAFLKPVVEVLNGVLQCKQLLADVVSLTLDRSSSTVENENENENENSFKSRDGQANHAPPPMLLMILSQIAGAYKTDCSVQRDREGNRVNSSDSPSSALTGLHLPVTPRLIYPSLGTDPNPISNPFPKPPRKQSPPPPPQQQQQQQQQSDARLLSLPTSHTPTHLHFYKPFAFP